MYKKRTYNAMVRMQVMGARTPKELPVSPWKSVVGTARGLAGALATALLAGSALAAYPDKPITIVVPFAPGGTTDLAARLVGDLLQKTTGATVLIDNKVGAGGMQTRFRKILETSNIKLTD